MVRCTLEGQVVDLPAIFHDVFVRRGLSSRQRFAAAFRSVAARDFAELPHERSAILPRMRDNLANERTRRTMPAMCHRGGTFSNYA
jgi:hypothetical protein